VLLDPTQEDAELGGRESQVTALRVLGVTHPDPLLETPHLNAGFVVHAAAVRALAPLHDHEYLFK
jgi:hypothetical protein